MKKWKSGNRVLALVLTFIMVFSLIPASVLAAINDIATGTEAGNTGIKNDTLGNNGTINWPVKIYDYLADGMLFEYSNFNGEAILDESYSTAGGGLYGGGAPMPVTKLGSDYTGDWIYTTFTANYPSGNYNPSNNYTKTKRTAVANSSPQYLRLTRAGDYKYANYCVADFVNDWGAKPANQVRYMVVVYRSSGLTASGSTPAGSTPAFHMNSNIGSISNWTQMKYTGTFQNSSDWTYMLIDLKAAYDAHNGSGYWDSISSNIWKIYIRLNMDASSDYFDLSHVAFFNNSFEAEQYGKAAVAFDKNPGERKSTKSTKSTTNGWNAGNNLGFGMLLPSSGGNWELGGGSNSLNNGYNTYKVGYTPYAYSTSASVFNDNRVDRNGKNLGTDNKIYYVSSSYASQDAYKNKYPSDYQNGFNMADLDLDGYKLLTHATQGLMTVGLLEGELENGRPVYREEAISYIAEMLEKTLVIPQKDSGGKYNYNFVKGQESSQYATSGKSDLAQALRNCLGIKFTSGQNKGSAPTFGSYAETKAKASSLVGEFLDVKDNINTCMDAAYFLLNNLFVDNSYNQLQTDYKYLTLSSAKMSDGKSAYVFDAGFSNGANNADLASGKLTQNQYKEQSKSSVEYSSLNQGGDGTISMGPVQGKDLFYYSGSSTTTRFPFLPVTNATGDYAGQTKSYYMMEDGYRSYTKDGGTYINRNFDYVLTSNGEFVFNEEDGLFFEFEGDDDVYLFINDQLVLDIGGAHSISNVSFQVNDYVKWAREVVANPDNYSAEEVKRAQALDLVDGEIVKFDFYYMERHGYGANMRIVTNMHVTDPALRVEKSAYQFGEQVEVGGIVNPNVPIEYNFKIKNTGNTKLYNLTFDDSNIGVKLNPTDGLLVKGDDTPDDLSDDINGYYITDARGGTLEANDLTAVVTGYMPDSNNGDYIKDLATGEYSKVAAGAGTHVYTEVTIHFNDNNALKVFLKTLEGDGLDDGTIDDELTQSGSGLWVDAEVTFKGIYYTLTDEQAEAGVFDNTVNVTATTKFDPNGSGNETLRSAASHRIYVAGIPYYYQWSEHNLFVQEKRILDDATKASKTTGNKLSEYEEFFEKVKGDTSVIYTSFCDKYGRKVDYAPDVSFFTQQSTGERGCLINYTEPGTHEFYLLMRLESTGSGNIQDVSGLNKGDYAIVRVMVHSTKVQDSTYVLDYGLKTEELDANGELFKNDDLLGAQSGTAAKLMGINTTGATYLDPKNNNSEFNRIDFEKMPLDEKNRIDVKGDDSVDGYFTFNMNIPDNGKIISYNANNGKYSLSAVGTVPLHVQVPVQWRQAYLYYWYDGGADNGWPGTAMNLDRLGHFSLSIPGDVPHVIISNGQQQTVNIDINPGEEAWITIDGTTNADGKLIASTEYHTQDGIIHAQVPDDWEEVCLYYWDEYDNNNEWPGEPLEVDQNGFYTMNIPGNVHYVIINNGDKGKQTSNQPVYAGKETWITVNNNNPSYNEETKIYYYSATSSRSTEKVKMHATVPEDWETASLYYWNSNGSGTGVEWPGIAMTKQADGTYTVENIPADVTNVIVNDGKKEGAKQTNDLLITPGLETWINISNTVTNTNVEATVPANYGDVYFYFFGPNGDVGPAWPGIHVTDTDGDGVYTMKAPAGATKVIVNNGNGTQSQNLMLTPNKTNSYYIIDSGKANTNTKTKLFISVPDDWGTVAIHHWNDTSSTTWPGDIVTEQDENGRYIYELDGDRTGFIINNNNGRQTGNINEFCLGAENKIDVYTDNNFAVSSTSEMPTGYNVDITYGEDAEKLGFTFTPTDFMDSMYNLFMAITVHETTGEPTPLGRSFDINKEVQMYKKVTVLPANVVYYEDDFTGIKYDTTDSANSMVHIGNGSGSLSQNVDQELEYGKDPTYQNSLKPDYSGDSQTQVSIGDTKPFATFDFTGTGFEIIGRTNAVDSSTARVVVKDSTRKVVKTVAVITEFDNDANDGDDAINQVPIVRVNGLAFGKYTVEINGVPVYDFSNMVGNKPSVKESWLIIDGIRIFQPLADDEDGTAGKNDAYIDTENGADFEEIRNLIADRQAFAIKYDDTDGLSVSGGTNTWIENRNNTLPSDENLKWTNNIVNSVNDYLLAGPNNEVYMQEVSANLKSALAFYVQEDGTDVHNMQIAARAIDYGQFNAQKATGANAELQYGAYVNGEYVWKTLSKVTTSTEQYYTIPYTECPYDAENDRYQVVIRVADTTTPGMASFTSLKYNGLKLCTLNSSEVPDVIYDYDELGNTLVDSTGKTLETSKFVDFIGLVDQMTSDKEDDGDEGGTGDEPVDPEKPTVVGTDTSSLGVLADTFTANSNKNFALSEDSKFYIVTQNESSKPSDKVVDTVKLVQSQFAADSLPSAEPMEIVWGLEKYATDGDILIYVNSSYSYGDEEYKLEVAENAKVYSKDVDGLLYGLNTLQKHFRKAGTNAIKGFTTQDKPDTKDRIVHLDVARKYLTKDWIKNYIAEMSWMGYNALEFHMSEDGGFRSDIWDENTIKLNGMSGNDFSWAIGSRKQSWNYSGGADPDAGRYLTTAELIEICETAKEYHIDIIPSFDTPAHVDWITTTYAEQVAAGNTSIKTFKYNGTTYTLPNTIHYNNGYSALNLANNSVKNLAFAMYNDMAVFFKAYAGSTKFNIGGDELGLYSSSGYTYTDVYNYINDVNKVLKKHDYTSRVYNDFFYRKTTVDNYSKIFQTNAQLDSDIEVVIWTADGSYTAPPSQWVDSGRTVYGGINFWTYYVLRYFDHPDYTDLSKYPDWGKDARDPSNNWWGFYRNTEDAIYNEWTPGLLSGYNKTKYELTNNQLQGGYFMVWCDNAAVNTEVEMWNGVRDESTSANKGKYFYSLIDRMWSNAIKQWNWNINSNLTFADYETIRDTMGYFPGYVATPSTQNYANTAVLPQSTEVSNTAYLPSYTVTFKDYDGTVIDTQSVKLGESAVAPVAPVRPADGYYTYTFAGWNKDFSNITGNLTITAQYDETAIDHDTSGYLELKVSGGTDILMSVDDGIARPLGKHYYNHHMDFGKQVKVTAQTTNDNTFVGWINATTGDILTTERTYTFYTTGNDVLIAMFKVDLDGMNTVTFRNDKSNQIIDIQYYSPDSDIVFPEDPSFLGYEFAQWDHTEEEIRELLVQGEDVTVRPIWEVKDVYVNITVNGGAVTKSAGVNTDGKYLAYKSITVTANAAPNGQMFSHWEDADGNILSYDKEYKFYPYKDTELTAMYVSNTSLKLDYDVLVNAGIDSTTLGDSNTIFFSWSVPEKSEFTFISAGVLFADKNNYSESTFVVGTLDRGVTQFVPAKKYQTSTGSHSITKTGVETGDEMVARAFVMYRDADGILRIAYSDTITAKK